MEDKTTELIISKLDVLDAEIRKLSVESVRQSEIDNKHRENIERFWTQTWPKVEGQIENNRTKILQVELSLAKLNTQMKIWGTSLLVGVPILLKLLF